MKKTFLIFLILLFAAHSFAYDIIFKSGFEGTVAVDACAATKIQWSDCAGSSCLNNTAYCAENVGCNDSVTGFNWPQDLPGEYRVEGTTKPYFNIIGDCTEVQGGVTAVDFVNGAQGFRQWRDEDAIYDTRWQLVVRDSDVGGAQDYDKVVNAAHGTAFRYWLKLGDLPDAVEKTLIMVEYWSLGSRFQLTWDGAKVVAYYYGGTTAYPGEVNTDTVWGTKNDTVTWPEDTWFQMAIYHKRGNPGRVLWKIKYGGTEYTIIDFNARNNQTDPSYWMPMKYYTAANGFWIYYDDFTIFDVSGVADFPAWDDDPQDMSPAQSATEVSTTADLTWSNPTNADITVDVYFDKNTNPPTTKVVDGGTGTVTYDPGTMDTGSTYYWKVVYHYGLHDETSGVYSFETEGPSSNVTGVTFSMVAP